MADFPDILGAPLRARFVSLGIDPAEVDERFIRGAGPGGQKINKASTTVWLRHRPTGVEARSQRERSQLANRLDAWTELCTRLEDRRRAEDEDRRHERERTRRRNRQKSQAQKVRMIEAKKHRARTKAGRGRIGPC